MPYTTELMDEGEWAVGLKSDTPRSVLNDIDIRTYAYASIVVTPQHFTPGTIADATLLDQAIYTGVYLAQGDNGLNLAGKGLIWLAGGSDNGAMITADGTFGTVTIEDLLDNNFFGVGGAFGNGLTKGAVTVDATTRKMKYESGTTRRQLLDTACAAYEDPNYEWRVNMDGTVDVDVTATLYPTAATPTVILTQDGGRDGNIVGIRAEIDVDSIDVEDFRTNIVVDWNDGTSNGSATNTAPTYWVGFGGAALVLRSVIDWRPKVGFRDRPNRSIRANAARYAAWVVNSATQANNVAKQAATASASYDIELSADVDEYNPARFVSPGDYVWVYDLGRGLVDTSNEIYYRGGAVHPQKVRVQRMTAPIQEGMGVYLRRWTGAAFDYYDLTDYVEFEDDPATLELGTRRQFTARPARPKRFNLRRIRAQARQRYRVVRYVTGGPPT